MLDVSADEIGPIHIFVRVKHATGLTASGALSRNGRLVFEWSAQGLRAVDEPGDPVGNRSDAGSDAG